MKKRSRRTALLLSALLLLPMLTACSGQTPKDNTGRQDLIVAMIEEPGALDPYTASSTSSGYVIDLIYATLLRPNAETLEPEPCLAEYVQPISDTIWEVRLRENVQFHNGAAMTAEDVAATMEWAREEKQVFTSEYTQWWTGIEIIDDLTLHITTDGPYANALADLTKIRVLPKDLIENGHDFNQEPIGAGPYRLVKRVPGKDLQFEAFENYFEGSPAIRSMTWRAIPQSTTRALSLQAQDVDVVLEVENGELDALCEDPNVTVMECDSNRFCYMALNHDKSPFDNENFRKALCFAVDRSNVLEVAAEGRGTEVYGQVPSFFEVNMTENAQTYDLEAAKEYLAESGIDPAAVQFTCLCTEETKRTAEVVQGQLTELGILMDVHSVDQASWADRTATGDYDAAICTYTAGDLQSFVEDLFASTAIGGTNRSRLVDGQLDGLIEEAAVQTDGEAHNALLMQCVERANTLCPQIPLYQRSILWACSSDLQGLSVTADGRILWQNAGWPQ